MKIKQNLEINWEKRLERTKKNKKFTKDDKRLAQLWITCPISELVDYIEFKENQHHLGPEDIYLVLDGIFFTKGVENDDVDLAINCYKSIHERVEKLQESKALT